MGYNIGPTIAVKGEQEYQKAMRNIRAEMGYLKSEVAALTSGYKANDDQMGELTARCDGLKRAMELQSQAVEEAQRALDRMAANGVDSASKAYRDMERNLDNARTALNKSQAEYNEAKRRLDDLAASADEAGDELKDTGEKGERAGDSIDAAFSALSGVGGPFGDVINSLKDVVDGLEDIPGPARASGEELAGAFSSGMAGAAGLIAAIAGVVTELVNMGIEAQRQAYDIKLAFALDEQDLAKDFELVFKTLRESNKAGSLLAKEEVEDAFLAVRSYIGVLEDADMTNVVRQAAEIARAFNVDVNEVVKAGSVLMNQFGIAGTQAMNDLLAALQAVPREADEGLDVISEYANQFAALGFSAQDFATVFSASIAEGGFSIDKVGDSVKELGIRVKEGTDDVRAALSDLGLDADATIQAFAQGGPQAKAAVLEIFTALEQVDNAVEQNRIGVELMGTQWEDTGASVIIPAINSVGASVMSMTDSGKAAIDGMMAEVSVAAANETANAAASGAALGAAVTGSMQTSIMDGAAGIVGAVNTVLDSAAAAAINKVASAVTSILHLGKSGEEKAEKQAAAASAGGNTYNIYAAEGQSPSQIARAAMQEARHERYH